MVTLVVCDREIRDVVTKLLAYERKGPIQIRMVSPRIHDARLTDGWTLSRKINFLIKFKGASITLIVRRKTKEDIKEEELLQNLEDMGVRIHFRKNLHVKTILLDSAVDKAVLISSSNLTPTGLEIQREMGAYFLNERSHIYERVDRYITELLKEEASPI
jgi:phosphatidylserine/phosphatidylglycerophosphate/cardiolipin synthase-like enzyme